MAASIKEYIIKVTADVKSAQSELDKLGQSFQKITISKNFTDAIQKQTDAVTGSLGKVTQELSKLQGSVSSVSTALSSDIKGLMSDLNTSIKTLQTSFSDVSDVFKNFSGNGTTSGLASSFEKFNKQIDQMITSYNSVMEKFSGVMAQGTEFTLPSSKKTSSGGGLQRALQERTENIQNDAKNIRQQTQVIVDQTTELEAAVQEYKKHLDLIKKATRVGEEQLSDEDYLIALQTTERLADSIKKAKKSDVNRLKHGVFDDKQLNNMIDIIRDRMSHGLQEFEKKEDVRTLPVRFVVKTDIELDEKSEDGGISTASQRIVNKIQEKIQNEIQKEVSNTPIRIPIAFTSEKVVQDAAKNGKDLSKITDAKHNEGLIENLQIAINVTTDGIAQEVNNAIESLANSGELKKIEIPVVPKQINTRDANAVAGKIISSVEDNLELTGRSGGLPIPTADGLATEQTLATIAKETTLQSILGVLRGFGNSGLRVNPSPDWNPPVGDNQLDEPIAKIVKNAVAVLSSDDKKNLSDLQTNPKTPSSMAIKPGIRNENGIITSQKTKKEETAPMETFIKMGVTTMGKVVTDRYSKERKLLGEQNERLSALSQEKQGLSVLKSYIKGSGKKGKSEENLLKEQIQNTSYKTQGDDTQYASYGKSGETLDQFQTRLRNQYRIGASELSKQTKEIEAEFSDEALSKVIPYDSRKTTALKAQRINVERSLKIAHDLVDIMEKSQQSEQGAQNIGTFIENYLHLIHLDDSGYFEKKPKLRSQYLESFQETYGVDYEDIEQRLYKVPHDEIAKVAGTGFESLKQARQSVSKISKEVSSITSDIIKEYNADKNEREQWKNVLLDYHNQEKGRLLGSDKRTVDFLKANSEDFDLYLESRSKDMGTAISGAEGLSIKIGDKIQVIPRQIVSDYIDQYYNAIEDQINKSNSIKDYKDDLKKIKRTRLKTAEDNAVAKAIGNDIDRVNSGIKQVAENMSFLGADTTPEGKIKIDWSKAGTSPEQAAQEIKEKLNLIRERGEQQTQPYIDTIQQIDSNREDLKRVIELGTKSNRTQGEESELQSLKDSNSVLLNKMAYISKYSNEINDALTTINKDQKYLINGKASDTQIDRYVKQSQIIDESSIIDKDYSNSELVEAAQALIGTGYSAAKSRVQEISDHYYKEQLSILRDGAKKGKFGNGYLLQNPEDEGQHKRRVQLLNSTKAELQALQKKMSPKEGGGFDTSSLYPYEKRQYSELWNLATRLSQEVTAYEGLHNLKIQVAKPQPKYNGVEVDQRTYDALTSLPDKQSLSKLSSDDLQTVLADMQYVGQQLDQKAEFILTDEEINERAVEMANQDIANLRTEAENLKIGIQRNQANGKDTYKLEQKLKGTESSIEEFENAREAIVVRDTRKSKTGETIYTTASKLQNELEIINQQQETLQNKLSGMSILKKGPDGKYPDEVQSILNNLEELDQQKSEITELLDSAISRGATGKSDTVFARLISVHKNQLKDERKSRQKIRDLVDGYTSTIKDRNLIGEAQSREQKQAQENEQNRQYKINLQNAETNSQQIIEEAYNKLLSSIQDNDAQLLKLQNRRKELTDELAKAEDNNKQAIADAQQNLDLVKAVSTYNPRTLDTYQRNPRTRLKGATKDIRDEYGLYLKGETTERFVLEKVDEQLTYDINKAQDKLLELTSKKKPNNESIADVAEHLSNLVDDYNNIIVGNMKRVTKGVIKGGENIRDVKIGDQSAIFYAQRIVKNRNEDAIRLAKNELDVIKESSVIKTLKAEIENINQKEPTLALSTSQDDKRSLLDLMTYMSKQGFDLSGVVSEVYKRNYTKDNISSAFDFNIDDIYGILRNQLKDNNIGEMIYNLSREKHPDIQELLKQQISSQIQKGPVPKIDKVANISLPNVNSVEIKAQNAESERQKELNHARYLQAVDSEGKTGAQREKEKEDRYQNVKEYSAYKARKTTASSSSAYSSTSLINDYIENERELEAEAAAAEQFLNNRENWVEHSTSRIKESEQKTKKASQSIDESLRLSTARDKADYINRLNTGLESGLRLGQKDGALAWAKSTQGLAKGGFADITDAVKGNANALNELADSYYKVAEAKTKAEQPTKQSSQITQNLKDAISLANQASKSDYINRLNIGLDMGMRLGQKDNTLGWAKSSQSLANGGFTDITDSVKGNFVAINQLADAYYGLAKAKEEASKPVSTPLIESTSLTTQQAQQAQDSASQASQSLNAISSSANTAQAQTESAMAQTSNAINSVEKEANETAEAINGIGIQTGNQSGVQTGQKSQQNISSIATLPTSIPSNMDTGTVTAEASAMDQLQQKIATDIPAQIQTKNSAFIQEAALVKSVASEEAAAFDQLIEKLEKIANLAANFKFDFSISGGNQLTGEFIQNFEELLNVMNKFGADTGEKAAQAFKTLSGFKFSSKGEDVAKYFKDLSDGITSFQDALNGKEINHNFESISDIIAKISNAGNSIKDMATILKNASKLDSVTNRYSNDVKENQQIKDLIKEYDFLANPRNAQKFAELRGAADSGKVLNVQDSTWLQDYAKRANDQEIAVGKLRDSVSTLPEGREVLDKAQARHLENIQVQTEQYQKYVNDYGGFFDKAMSEIYSGSESLGSQFSGQIDKAISAIRQQFEKVNSKEIGLDTQKQNVKEIIKQFNDVKKQHSYKDVVGMSVGGSIRDGSAVGLDDTIKSYIKGKGYTQIRDISGGAINSNGIANFAATVVDAEGKVKELKFTWDSFSDSLSVSAGVQRNQFATGFLGMITELQAKSKQLFVYWTANLLNPYRLIGYAKQIFNVVKEFDSALTEMRKVSDEPVSVLRNYQSESFGTAGEIGTTATTLQQSTADWMRLGESINQAKESAKDTTILFNVSEFDSINDATKALISMSQAYQDLDKMDIIDKVNNIGNNFSVSTSDLATGLQNAAAVLKSQGNDIDQSIALLTAGNAVTQDISKTSAGIRTISLRIAGTEEQKQELKEFGEDIEDFTVQTRSKTDQIIRDYTAVQSNNYKGVSVLDDNGNLRSTYDILLDISKIYKEIQQEDKAKGTNRQQALVEQLAGKTRSNIAASILDNPTLLEDVFQSSQMSAGSAQGELSKYLDSIEGKLQQIKNSGQELIANIFDSEGIKTILDLLKNILDLVNGIVKAAGGLPPILGLISTLNLNKHGIKLFDYNKSTGAVGGILGNLFSTKTKTPVSIRLEATPTQPSIMNNIAPINVPIGDFQVLSETPTTEGMYELAQAATEATSGLTEFEGALTPVVGDLGSQGKKGLLNSLKGFGTDVLSSTLTTIVTTFAIKGISALGSWLYKNTVGRKQEITKRGEEAKERLGASVKDYNTKADFVDTNLERYLKLRQGISATTGRNISLSTEEYSEFISLNSQMADMFPTLIDGYNSQGDAILKLSSNTDVATESVRKLLQEQRKYAAQKANGDLQDIFKSAFENIDDYEKKLRAYNSDVASIDNDIFIRDVNSQSNIDDYESIGVYASSEDAKQIADEVYKSSGRSLESFSFQLSNKRAELLQKQNSMQQEMQATWNGIAPSLVDQLVLYDEYSDLGLTEQGKKLQDVIAKEISSINISALSNGDRKQLEDPDTQRAFIKSKYIDPIVFALNNFTGDRDEIEKSLLKFFEMDFSKMSVKDMNQYINDYVAKLFPLNQEQQINFKLQLNYSIEDDQGSIRNSSDLIIDKIHSYFGGNIFGDLFKEDAISKAKLESLTNEQLSWIDESINAGTIPEYVTGWESLIGFIDKQMKKTQDIKTGTFADLIQNFDASPFVDDLSAITDAISKFKENGELSDSDITTLMKEIPGIKDFSLESLSDQGVKVLDQYVKKLRELGQNLPTQEAKQLDTYIEHLVGSYASLVPSMDAAFNLLKDSVVTSAGMDMYSLGERYEQVEKYNDIINALQYEYGEELDSRVIVSMILNDEFSGRTDQILAAYDHRKVKIDLEFGEDNFDKVIKQSEQDLRNTLVSSGEANRAYIESTGETPEAIDFEVDIDQLEENVQQKLDDLVSVTKLQNIANTNYKGWYDGPQNATDKEIATYMKNGTDQQQNAYKKKIEADEAQVQAEIDYTKQKTDLNNKEYDRDKADIDRLQKQIDYQKIVGDEADAIVKQFDDHHLVAEEEQINQAASSHRALGDLYNQLATQNDELYDQYGRESDKAAQEQQRASSRDEYEQYRQSLIKQPQQEIVRLNDQMEQLQDDATIVQDAITLREGRGLIPTLDQYSKLLRNGEQQIRNLKDTNVWLNKEKQTLKQNGQYYGDIEKQINANNSAIASMEGNMQGWSDAIKSYAETVGTNLSSVLQQQISESFSDTGLTSESMKQLAAQFEGLGDGDFSELFYDTANGVKLDMIAVQGLVKAQQKLITGDLTRRIQTQNTRLNQLKETYRNTADAAEKMKLASQMDASRMGIDNLYNQMAQYQARYAEMMKQFTQLADFQRAQESANAGDNYKTLQGYFETQEKAWESGEIGTDEFKTYGAIFDEWGRTSVQAYTENRDMIKRYLTEDETGFVNFYDDLVKAGFGTYDAETGLYSMDLPDIDKIAHTLGVGSEFAEYIFGRSEDYGFYNDFVRDQIDGELKLKETEHDLAEAIARKYDLMRQGAPQNVIDEANAEIERLDQRTVNLRENTADVVAQANTITSTQIQSAIDVLRDYKKRLNQAQSDSERHDWEKSIRDFAEQNHIPLTFDYDVDTNQLDKMYKDWNQTAEKLSLQNRPQISAEVMRRKGYTDVEDGSVATVYSSSASNKDETHTVVMTPILENGEVLDAKSFNEYMNEVVEGGEDTKGLVLRAYDGEDSIQQANNYSEALHEVQESWIEGGEIRDKLATQLKGYTAEELKNIDYTDGAYDQTNQRAQDAERTVDSLMKELGLSSDMAREFVDVMTDMGLLKFDEKAFNMSLGVETGQLEGFLSGTRYEGITSFDAMSMSADQLQQKLKELSSKQFVAHVKAEGGEEAYAQLEEIIKATEKQYNLKVGVEAMDELGMDPETFLGLNKEDQIKYMVQFGVDSTNFDAFVQLMQQKRIQLKVDTYVSKKGISEIKDLLENDPDSLKKELEVEFDGNTEQAEQAFEALKAKVEGEEASMKVALDDKQFETLLSTISASQNQTPINITINTVAALQSIAAISAAITTLRVVAFLPINIKVNTETAVNNANALRDAINEIPKNTPVKVNARVYGTNDVYAVRNQINSVDSTSVKVTVSIGSSLYNIRSVANELNSLHDRVITVTTIKTTVNAASGSTGAAGTSNNIRKNTWTRETSATGTLYGVAHASGTAYNTINTKSISAYAGGKRNVALPKDEDALVNELNPESIIFKKVTIISNNYQKIYLIAGKPLELYLPQRNHEIQINAMV